MLHPEQRAVLEALGHDVEHQEEVWAVQTHLQDVLEERLWAGILRHHTCFTSNYVIKWGRKHGINLKPVALLVEMYADPFHRYTDRVEPTRLDLFRAAVENDLFDDTATCTPLMDADALRVWLQSPTPSRHDLP